MYRGILGQQDHGLDVVRDFNSVVPEFPKEGGDLVNGEGGIGVFRDDDVHDCLEVEVHGHDTGLIVLGCQFSHSIPAVVTVRYLCWME
jgi:hypothetical protein